jgi:hypothetical protein
MNISYQIKLLFSVHFCIFILKKNLILCYITQEAYLNSVLHFYMYSYYHVHVGWFQMHL